MKKLKQQNNKSLYYVLIMTFVFSILVFSGVESSTVQASTNNGQTEVKTDKIPTNSKIFAQPSKDDSEIDNSTGLKTIKSPKTESLFKKDTKPNQKYSVKRFLIAMLCVLFSALTILGGLKFYKYLNSKNSSFTRSKKNKNSLESPKNLKETINLFLDKTEK